MSRAAKRPRTTAYFDQVDHGIDDIHAREGKLNKSGINNVVEPLPVRETFQEDTDTWRTLTSWGIEEDTTFALDPDDGRLYDEAVNRDVMDESTSSEVQTLAPKKQYVRSRVSVSLISSHEFRVINVSEQKRPHVVWKEVHRQTYLTEMMRLEGRGDFRGTECPDCRARKVAEPSSADYRCQECLVPDLVCASCCVRRHRTTPFHRIEVRLGFNFSTYQLKPVYRSGFLQARGSLAYP